MRRIHDLSALARPLDPDYPTNRWIAVLALGTGVLGGLVGLLAGGGAIPVLWRGAHTGGVVFAAWAVTREVDPDAETAALVAAGLAIAWMGAVWIAGARAPSLALGFALLLLCRMVARTVGSPPRLFDGLVVLVIATWAGAGTGAWTVPALAAAGFAADRALSPRGPAHQLAFAGLALAAALGVGWWRGIGPAPWEAGMAWAVAAAATLVFVPRIFRAAVVRSTADATGRPLEAARVRAAMLLAVAVAASSLGLGRPHALEAGVLWAALGGGGAAHIVRSLRALVRP